MLNFVKITGFSAVINYVAVNTCSVLLSLLYCLQFCHVSGERVLRSLEVWALSPQLGWIWMYVHDFHVIFSQTLII